MQEEGVDIKKEQEAVERAEPPEAPQSDSRDDTFVVTLIPPDLADEVQEIRIPKDWDYMQRLCKLLDADEVDYCWPRKNRNKNRGGCLINDRHWRTKQLPRNERASVVFGGNLNGSSILFDVYTVDAVEREDQVETVQIFEDCDKRRYEAMYAEATRRGEEEKTSAGRVRQLLQTVRKPSPNKLEGTEEDCAIPLAFRAAEWPGKPPKSLLQEYRQKYWTNDVQYNKISTSAQGPFLVSAYVPDLGLEFTPNPEFATNTLKYAEHQAALLVLQHLQGSVQLCGTSKKLCETSSLEPDEERKDGDEQEIDLTGDGGIVKRILRIGDGEKLPSNARVMVNYIGRLVESNKVFDSTYQRKQPHTFQLGSGEVLPGLDLAVASMLPREVSRFILQPRYGYGPLGVPNLIPAQATIEFEIELMSGNAALAEPTVQSQLEAARTEKAEGNMFVKNSEFKLALKCYNRKLHSHTEEERLAAATLTQELQLNIAHAALKLKQFDKAADNCEKVLKSDPACGKALCRRGQAYIALQRFDEARADLSRAQELCPGETEYLRGQLEALRKKEDECKRREAAMCRNMFSA